MPWSMNARSSASDRLARSSTSLAAIAAWIPLYGARTFPDPSNISSNASAKRPGPYPSNNPVCVAVGWPFVLTMAGDADRAVLGAVVEVMTKTLHHPAAGSCVTQVNSLHHLKRAKSASSPRSSGSRADFAGGGELVTSIFGAVLPVVQHHLLHRGRAPDELSRNTTQRQETRGYRRGQHQVPDEADPYQRGSAQA